MREIKFRAWYPLHRKFNVCNTHIDGTGLLFWQFGYNCDVIEKEERDEIVIQFYTGLKDKNGKESYYDDVLRWRDSTFRVVWDDECGLTMLRRLSGTDGMSEIPAHNIKQGEVIGNIWENEELFNA